MAAGYRATLARDRPEREPSAKQFHVLPDGLVKLVPLPPL